MNTDHRINPGRRLALMATLMSGLPAALSACAAPRPAQPVPLSVISFGGGFNLPLWAAREQGFFARHGLAPTLHITMDSRQVFTGLMDGRYHVAITAFDNIVAYQEGQGEVKFDPPSDFFAFMGSDDGFLSLVSAPEVRSFEQLRGKTISVDAMTNGFSFALREMLHRHGLTENDVQWARAGGTDRRYAALVSRQHAATMLRAPFDLQAQKLGFNTLARVRDELGAYMGITGAARRSWAKDNDAAVVGFIRAYRDAVRWLKEPVNRAQARALLMANVPNMNETLAEQSCELMLNPVSGFYSDVRLDPQGVQQVLALRGRLGEPVRTLNDPTRYLDERYWQRAMAS